MKLCPKRRPLARAAAVSLALATAGAGLAAPAFAAPTPDRDGGQAVLIVHVAAGHSVAALASRLGLPVRHRFGSLRALSVRVPAADAGRQAARLQGVAGVASVERGVRRSFYGTAAPDDTYYAGRQASYLTAVDAPAAWARQKGSSSVTIAVLDSGVDVTHPDLKNKIVATYNAHDRSSDVTDAVGHGTFVAGVAAAETGNHLGVAGAGYNTRIDAVKIADPDGAIDIDDEVAGIRWATAQHAAVINLSLGGPDRSSAEAAAIAAAQRAGVVVVAAAGNDSDSTPSYPAAYPGVIAVGATDSAHRARADFSNYGSWVTVAAPGVGIFSTVPRDSDMWGHVGGRYTKGDGTSFSTPLVAGEVALLRAANAHATVSQLRHAVSASAHGYAHAGLGTGQVDFAGALRHVPPASAPTALSTAGTSGVIKLTAHASAPQVAFRVDDERLRTPVPTHSGAATTSFASWGYRNGTHRIRAYACTAYGECGGAREVSATVANPAPVIASPARSATVTGRVLVRATSAVGGPLRLLVDGRSSGVVDAAPYTFAVSTSDLADGAHTLQVQGCSRDHRHCAGPRSLAVPVTARGLHPVITSVTPRHVSPNRDHVHDTATIRFRLPARSEVRVRVLDAAATLVRTARLGSLRAGAHRWTWNGRGASGARLRDGRYVLALDTVRGSRRGWVSRSVVIDTRRPALGRPTTTGTRLYPSRDGYRDRFAVRTRLGEAGRLTLLVRTASGGHLVRRVSLRRGAGPATITWNGRTAGGHAVPAGSYRWQLRLTDAAGNTTRSRTGRLTVSAKRLTPVTRYVTLAAGRYRTAGGTAPCATARRSDSAFAGGVLLVNRCATNGFDLAFADYTFTLPRAIRYRSVTFEVRGTSRHRPSELTAAFTRTDGSIEIPDYATVRRAGTAWHRVARVPASGHVGARRHLRVSLLLDSFYPGRNDLDAAQVRLRVRMILLR